MHGMCGWLISVSVRCAAFGAGEAWPFGGQFWWRAECHIRQLSGAAVTCVNSVHC
jgi:hypothetical protein